MSSTYERLAALDEAFLWIEQPHAPMHMGATLVFEPGQLARSDGGIDVPAIRRHVASRLHRSPRYRQKIAWIPLVHRPVWIDDWGFDLERHLRHIGLPRPGSPAQLKLLSAQIMEQPLDPDRPLWQMNIVEGLEGGRFALLAKVHHCMVDGVSGIDLLNVILSPQPEIGSSASPEFRPRPNPSDLELLRDELYRRVARPAKTLRAVRRYLARATESPHDLAGRVRALGGLLGSAFRRPSATPLNRPIGGQRRIDWLTTAREPVEEIRRRFGGSLNDVVLAVVTAAMRRTLNRRQVSLAAMNLRAMTPVDVRSDAERGTVGNRVAAWLVDLPVREPDPREQLHQIHASTLKLKEAGSPVGSAVLGEMSEWTSSALLISLSARYVTHLLPCNLVVTNIPGPPCTVHLLEAPLSEAFPLVPITHGLGLNVGIMTYDRKVCWGFTADYDLVPDLDTFARDIEESFEALRRAALPVDISSPQPTSDPEPSTRDSRRVGAAQEKRKRSHPPKARPESRP